MRQCLICDNVFCSDKLRCDNCGYEPNLIDGIEQHVEEKQAGGFDKSFFKQLAELEANNFWFKARNDLIALFINTYAAKTKRYLEIGCGTGFVLDRVSSELIDASVFASEYFSEGLSFAKQRTPKASFLRLDGRRIPFSEEYDLIGMFDVLEHIDKDQLVLDQVYKALLPNGKLILTVPQHKWLWSQADEYAHHQRRYSSWELDEKLKKAGFKVQISSSFVVTLFPLLVLSRLLQRSNKLDSYDPLGEFSIPGWVNTVFYRLLSFEIWLIGKGVRFSFGGSRIAVALKPLVKNGR